MKGSIKTTDDTIRNYLRKLNAVIPNYQRSYEWGEDQITDFLEDLYNELPKDDENKNTTSISNTSYFFGPIITTEESSTGEKQIIDGQQRLTTTTIFLAVIRDLLSEFKDIEDSNEIQIIIKNDLIGDGSEYYPFKLSQKGTIEEYFRNNIQRYEKKENAENKKIFTGTKAKGQSNVNKIIRAYNFILSYLRNKLEEFVTVEEKFRHLKKVFTVFANTFFVVEISTPDRSEAFQIFQTINARGLDLSAADLIKSDFFGNSGDNTEEVISTWSALEETLGDLNLSDFIRYVWNSQYDFINKRGLYKKVSKVIKNSEDIIKFIKILSKLSEPYAELNGDIDMGYLSKDNSGLELKNILLELNELGFKTYYPLYLAMVYKDYEIRQILMVMKKVTSILIRNKMLLKGTNWLEKYFSTLAQRISFGDNEIDATVSYVVDSIETQIQAENLNDDVIRGLLTSYDFKKDLNLVRFILRSIENNSQKEKGSLPIDNKKVHIEHIMPQSPIQYEDWNIVEEAFGDYVWKLGNLTLLLDKNNARLGNKDFKLKKQIYKDSDVSLTRDLANNSKWTPNIIEKRTQTIIDEFFDLY